MTIYQGFVITEHPDAILKQRWQARRGETIIYGRTKGSAQRAINAFFEEMP